MDNRNRDFFWKSNMDLDYNHGLIALISRDKIYRSKCEGGLGIKKLQDVNAANLAKLGWKILKEPDNLWVKVVSTKYLTRKIFMEARKTANGSRIWKYILDHRYLLKKGICWCLGDGKNINF